MESKGKERKAESKMKPGVEIVNGFLIRRNPILRWEDIDHYRPDNRKGFVHSHSKWEVWDGRKLVCICCYRRGAVELAKYLASKGVSGRAEKVVHMKQSCEIGLKELNENSDQF